MSSRKRSLWWKEWRQLRLLRTVGAAMIVVAPVMLLSVAEAAKRGWLPLGGLQSYSASTVVQDALPIFLGYLIWPLLALMFAAQSYCGDIAAGTEWFWMARPVQPRRVWMTRLLASLSSLLAVITLHWVVWRLLVAVWGDADSFDAVGLPTRWLLMDQLQLEDAGISIVFGLLVALAAFVATLAASAFVRTPMQALPLGLMLVALPLGLSQLLGALFPYARLGSFNLAAAVPLLLFAVYPIASYRSSCRGEPAGRGRLARGLSVLGVGVVGVVVLAAPAGIWSTQRAETMSLHDSTVVTSAAGDRFFIYNYRQGAGWLFDAHSGKELLHVPPYVNDAAWSASGNRLAVLRFGFGGILLDVYDRDGVALVESRACDRCSGIEWAGERLLVSTFHNRKWGFDRIDPSTGERTPLEIGKGELPLKMFGPTQDGTSYVARQVRVTAVSEDGSSNDKNVLLLYALDLDAGELADPVTIEGIDGYFHVGGLAPDGSGVLLQRSRESAVINFSEGSAKQLGWEPAWLQPNRPVWAERAGEDLAIFVDEEGVVRKLGQFEGHGAFDLTGSPDGNRLLLVRSPNVSNPNGVQALEHWLYDIETQSWAELEHTKVNDRHGWPAHPEWVNNETIVLRGVGVLALCDPGTPGPPRFLIGG